ncbi:MAG: hypothetical protein IT342_19880 [Candidatus Melainabacteria bacterium]|nr:hypothetical protein [Candidatus Melainabacteria bacterium]
MAVDALEDAIAENIYVIEYLCGLRKLPKHQPTSFSPRSPEEAAAYVSVAVPSWSDDKAALDWIADFIQREVRKQQLVKTFPGITLDSPASNVIDLNSFKLR